MNISDFFDNNKMEGCPWLTRRVLLNSGLSLSIQASSNHYCSPRADYDFDCYDSFELGYPSEEIEIISSYAEDPANPTETVYPNVPRNVVLEIVDANGGVKGFFTND